MNFNEFHTMLHHYDDFSIVCVTTSDVIVTVAVVDAITAFKTPENEVNCCEKVNNPFRALPTTN